MVPAASTEPNRRFQKRHLHGDAHTLWCTHRQDSFMVECCTFPSSFILNAQ